MYTSFVCVRCGVEHLEMHSNYSVVLPLLDLDLLRMYLFCVVVVVVVVVVVESEILLALIIAPRIP